jgi:sulfite reductase (NADPH) flavoprotein alpha-component
VLSRLDLAFSRDDTTKTYVQHRLRQKGRDVYAWLQEGAWLYICGDATHMAPDVHAALVDVVAEHGGHDRESAEEYLAALKRDRRYRLDVY